MSKVAKFDPEHPANELSRSSETEIEQLPFGAIEVDRFGVILRYNPEGQMSKSAPVEMLGRNIFKDIAPFADNEDLKVRLREGMESGRDSNTRLSYTLGHRRSPGQVRVKMEREPQGDDYWDTYWISVKRFH